VFLALEEFFVSEKVTRKNTFARYWGLFDEDFYINYWAGTDFHLKTSILVGIGYNFEAWVFIGSFCVMTQVIIGKQLMVQEYITGHPKVYLRQG
jgi:hypothetical protein